MFKDTLEQIEYMKRTGAKILFLLFLILTLFIFMCYVAGHKDNVELFNTGYTKIDSIYYTDDKGDDYLIYITKKEGE